MEEIKKTIKRAEEQLTYFDERIKKITKERRALYENERIIRKYAKLGEEKRELKAAREKLKGLYIDVRRQLIQANCSHPLWYLLESTNQDNQPYYTCICFKCLVTMIGMPKEFKNCLKVANPSYESKKQNDFSFENLFTKYRELKAVKANEYYANRVMIKKYNGR